jgi:hypothetical protein
VNLREQGESLVMNDAEGKEVSVVKAQIASRSDSRLSLMPPIFEQALSDKDLADVIAFLAAQTDAPR